ncbi:MAG TPA: GNAT family N-acetyltransferase [Actinomycetales bacterium]|jgi:predicted acetyltransferase
MLELTAPDVARHAAWLAAHREWGIGAHEDGFAVGPGDEVDSAEGFAAWVAHLHALPAARVWWIVDGDAVLGGIVLRTGTDAALLGHVGYGIRPSARGRGIATWALSEVLRHAREAGLRRLLLVCADDNVASGRTIQRCGGVLEGVADHGRGLERRYWVEL